ncbi:MAG: peroxiredoxin [Bacteroidetes bacterium]|nr:peroxiredoxin [Bacteroidota bacterium]
MQIGDKCPQFELTDQNGKQFKSNEWIGRKKLVIFFYPKDETSGCIMEACSFRDSHEDFLQFDCQVIGISSDSVLSHKKFASKYNFNYLLLADTDKTVRKLFQVPGSLFGLLPGRVTYIIDLEGKICGIHNSQLNPSSHMKESLKLLRQL